MNLIRNHILYFKGKIEEEMPPDSSPEDYPEIYHRETPPETPRDYMARADEIRRNARAALEVYKQNEDYLFLLSIEDSLDKKQREKISLTNVLGYARGLEIAINKDDLISMRRHERPDNYIGAFTGCANRVRALTHSEYAQVSIQL